MENMEDNIFVNIVAYSIVGALALGLIVIILAVVIVIVGKLAKYASKDMPLSKKQRKDAEWMNKTEYDYER